MPSNLIPVVNSVYWSVAVLALVQWPILIGADPLSPRHNNAKVGISGLALGLGLLLLSVLVRADFRKANLFTDAIPVILICFGPLLLLARPARKPNKAFGLALIALPVIIGFGHAIALRTSENWPVLYLQAWSMVGISFR